MLYVFHVDVGRMMNFDMTVALSSVENLKDTIERLHGIPAANIVLLVSGGEMLTQPTQVSYYSAGTDTNPIYMFVKGDIKLPPAVPQIEPDQDLREQVQQSLQLPAVYETVGTRAQLALRMHDLAREEERLCERLVHEQHLQQQGWSAVVANMEDLTDAFRQRFRNFCDVFDRHLEKRSTYLDLLQHFNDDLSKLSRIPILPGLMPLAEADFHGFDDFLEATDEAFARSGNTEHQRQQQSVLLAATATATADDEQQQQQHQQNGVSGDMAMAIGSADDKSLSTSPNKKLKMGSDSITTMTAMTGTSTETAAGTGEEVACTSQSSTTSTTSRRSQLNLLQWITSKENHNVLKTMSDECIQGLSTFNEEVYRQLKMEVQSIIKLAEQNDVKEIKGLGERLCKLDEVKYIIKKMVKDQKELSTAFQQNQNRAINLRDPSILPDLCDSHQSQLMVMLQNHQKIRDNRRLIANAKDELGTNLLARMKRIGWIENAMSEFDNRLLFYHRCLRRAERHIHIIEQIHQTPGIYVAAVTEVVRRKIFSGEFRLWASKLAEDFDAIHREEVARRQNFNANFDGHFLNILFPGMGDMPPTFANDNPLVFDARLPNITRSDIDILSTYLPELARQIELPNMEPVINFFVSRSGEHQRERLEKLLRDQIMDTLKPAAHTRLSELQKEDMSMSMATATGTVTGTGTASTSGAAAACEGSETDTETEFEKLPAATTTATIATSTSENEMRVETMARSTLTETLLTLSAATSTSDEQLQQEQSSESERAARAEVERLRGLLAALSKLAVECLRQTRLSLEGIRTQAITCQTDVQAELRQLNERWNVVREIGEAADDNRVIELQRQQTIVEQQEHELEMLRPQVQQMATLQHKCGNLEAEILRLREEIRMAQADKESAVARAREQLIHDHKTEIESLRCRFKLMTSMDRSPSDTSLEKLERPLSGQGGAGVGGVDSNNVIELAQHEAAMQQLRAQLDTERERAVSVAIEVERSIWQSKIFPMNSESVMANVGILKEMLEEKERQLEMLREQDLMLTKENFQLKTRLDALTNEDGNSWLKEKIEYLNRDKTRLEKELNIEKSRRKEMESSFAMLRDSTCEQGGSRGSSHKFVVLESCGKGDIVFVVWSMRHGQFMVVQDSPSLYFVHADSLAGLNLRLPPPADAADECAAIPMPYYAIGRVTDKEYCQAKKDENRYRVTRGSKFYRIKLAPLLTKHNRRERLESFSSSISRSASQCDSHSESSSLPSGGTGLRPSQSATLAMTTARDRDRDRDRDAVDSGLSSASASVAGSVSVSLAISSASPTILMASPGLGGAGGGGGSSSAFKERTVSITSVTEEDDEPVSLISDRYGNYGSVSEEEEPPITLTAVTEAEAASEASIPIPQTTTTTIISIIKPQASVITEQPTASNQLKLDLLLASADIPQQQQQHQQQESQQMRLEQQQQQEGDDEAHKRAEERLDVEGEGEGEGDDGGNENMITAEASATTMPMAIDVPMSVSMSMSTSTSMSMPLPLQLPLTIDNATERESGASSIPTTSEDSDEYRSLEPKDDADFPALE